MSIAENKRFEKEVEQIEAELGEDHLIRMLQYLTSNSPEASEGLVELHTQCREVISKYPPINPRDEELKNKTHSEGISKRGDKKSAAARVSKIKTEKPRIMMTKRKQ